MWSLILPKKRHVIALFLFLPLFLSVLYIVTKNNPAYIAAETYISEDMRISDSIGNTKRIDFNFWEGFNYTGSEANFLFKVFSEKGIYTIEVNLGKTSGLWYVKSSEIRPH